MDHALEKHLREIGILPQTTFDEPEGPYLDIRHTYLAKGYFNDPRDENGEVPF